jgi:hypothetical protein
VPTTGSAGPAITAFNNALKRQQTLPMMYDRVNRVLDFLRPAGLMSPTLDVFGQGLDVPLILRGPRSAVGNRAEREPMPDTNVPTFAKGQSFTKRTFFYFDVTEEQMAASASREGSWERAQAIYVFEGAQEVGDRIQTYSFLDGSARLCRLTTNATNVANSVITVADAGGPANSPAAADEQGAFYLKPGDLVSAAVPGVTPTFRTGVAQIVSINRDVTPNTVTLDGNFSTVAAPWVANDYLVFSGFSGAPAGAATRIALAAANVGQYTDCGAGTQSGGKAPEGLYRWFSDVNNYEFATTLGNPLTVATADNWAGFVLNDSAAPAPFDVQKFHRMVLTIVRRFGEKPSRFVSSHGVSISIAESLFTPDKRYNDTSRADKLGIDFKSMNIDGVDLMFSRSCPPQTGFMYCGREDCLAPNQQGPPHWAGMDGNVLHLVPQTGTQYEGILIFPWNLVSRARTGGSIWRGIRETAKVADISI